MNKYTETSVKQKLPDKIIPIIFSTTFSRLLLNTARRFIYPFAPAFARGLNVPLTSITGLIAVNQITSVLGPFIAPYGDRFGYRIMMLLSLVMLTCGMFAAGFLPFFSVLLISLFLAGLAKNIFDPALQAFVGKHVPYAKRGFIIGILEMAWAGSTLVGIPAAGWLIDRYSWQMPFIVFGILAFISIFLVLFFVPKDKKDASKDKKGPGFINIMKNNIKHRHVLGVLGFSFFVSIANDNLFVIYGAWLEDSFHMSLTAIGLGTAAIGVSEILGELLTVTFSDRLGLKKAVILGLVLSILSYLILPWMNGNIYLALTGLFFIFLTFEFTLVSSISLCTELVPESRASTISSFYAIGGIGRVIGAFLGGILWTQGGLSIISAFSGAMTFFALISLSWGFKNWRKQNH